MARTMLDVFLEMYRHVDQAAELPKAANAAERAFWSQTDRVAHKWPHYLPIYDRYLSRYRGTSARILEIGVHHGGSLQMWRRYLGPDARIHGLDIDPLCALVDDADLVVHVGSQDDPAMLRKIVDELGGLDVVIDDGSHLSAHQIASFEVLYPMLSPAGVYLVEDVHASYWPEYRGDAPFEGSFLAYARRLVDRLHCWYSLEDNQPDDVAFARMTGAISFFDSIVAFERATKDTPFHCVVGSRALVQNS